MVEAMLERLLFHSASDRWTLRQGIEIYKRVENLRILVCGGDGTVGWVLEVLDKMGLSQKHFPIGTLPLGTGNDLSRELKWGPGYDGMPIAKFLGHMLDSVTTMMDRWGGKLSRFVVFKRNAFSWLPFMEGTRRECDVRWGILRVL